MIVPFTDLTPHEDAQVVREAIARVLASGQFVLGREGAAFEERFAALSGARAAVAVASGTDALTLALVACGIGAGDEVITPAISAGYTALAIMRAGARPVFADVDPETLLLDPAAANAAVTRRTAAIMPVHLYGRVCDMTGIAYVAARNGLVLVEDCCQAHLAALGGYPVGTIGLIGAFSFYPTKNLGALGDGGAVVTSNRALAGKVRCLRNGGRCDRATHVEASGLNSRLDEVQAAVLNARLDFLTGWTARRRALAAQYRAALDGAPVTLVDRGDCKEGEHVHHLFVVRTPHREALQRYLADRGIETLSHYPVPLHRQPAFASSAFCPEAERACREVLSLPLYPSLGDEAIATVGKAICAFDDDEG